MGWITNGELGETANFSVLLIEYSGQNRIIPPCIFTLLLAVALKLCRKQLCGRIGNAAYWLIN